MLWFGFTQGAEKALIAAMYRINANTVMRGHNLVELSATLCTELQRLSQEMENLTGSYRGMRYPANDTLPSHRYSRNMARQAMILCERILDKVNEQL